MASVATSKTGYSRLPVSRGTLYFTLNAAFLFAVGLAAILSGVTDPRLLYVLALFALCSAPILDFDALNGRIAMLGAFMLIYFMTFGVGDVVSIVRGAATPAAHEGPLTETEAVILCGGLMLLVGYRWALRRASQRTYIRPARDWPASVVVTVGLVFFVLGTIATWYLNVYVMPDKNISADIRLGQLDPKLTAILLLGSLVLPLGIILLAYAYAAFRRGYMTALIVVVVAMQFVTGFVIDAKADAMLGGVIVILTRVLVDGRWPRLWLAGGALFLIVGFPFLQAYRAEVIGAQGLNHAEVARNLGRAVKDSWSAVGRARQARGDERVQDFFERISLKSSVDIAVRNLGTTVDYQYGRTLVPLALAFVPRLLVPQKFDFQSGRVFGREFRVSAYTDTYISPSHLGELYWNFGWPGVVAGMLGIGYLLGFIGARCDFSEYRSVTRLLIFASTAQLLVLRFEATITTNYVVWERAIAVVALLHFLLARVPATRGAETSRSVLARSPVRVARMTFPNVLP